MHMYDDKFQCEHRMARVTLCGHMGRPLRVDLPTREFTRDPRECQLTELLDGTLQTCRLTSHDTILGTHAGRSFRLGAPVDF